LKSGKVVIVLNGRMAGKKGLIVKTFDEGTDGRKYGHAIVAGIARAPLKVKKSMGEKKVEKRSRVKPFLKLVNFNHLMPTRLVCVALSLSRLAVPCTRCVMSCYLFLFCEDMDVSDEIREFISCMLWMTSM